MTDEKIEHVGIYIGKEFRREFDMKDDKKELLKDAEGKQVKGKIYGLTLKEKTDDQYGKSFTIFSTTKGFDTIEEGDKVKLGYVVKTFTGKHGEGKSNNVIYIGKTEDPCTSKGATNTAAPSAGAGFVFKEAEFNDMIFKYKESVNKEEFAPIQLMGMYLLNFHADTYWELYARCCKELGMEVPKR